MADVESELPSRLTRQSSLPTYEEAVNKKYAKICTCNTSTSGPSVQNFTQNPSDVNCDAYTSFYANRNYNQPVSANTRVNSGEVRSGNYVTRNSRNLGIYEV